MNCGGLMMAWDYANECAVPEKKLRADRARWAASEKAKLLVFCQAVDDPARAPAANEGSA